MDKRRCHAAANIIAPNIASQTSKRATAFIPKQQPAIVVAVYTRQSFHCVEWMPGNEPHLNEGQIKQAFYDSSLQVDANLKA
jgi:hypothetical protein